MSFKILKSGLINHGLGYVIVQTSRTQTYPIIFSIYGVILLTVIGNLHQFIFHYLIPGLNNSFFIEQHHILKNLKTAFFLIETRSCIIGLSGLYKRCSDTVVGNV